MFYVVKMDNPKDDDLAGVPTRVRLVGPFASDDAASDWGFDPTNNPHDNPCWQVVFLASPGIPVVAP